MYELDNTDYFYLLAATVLLVLLFAYNIYWRRSAKRRFGSPDMVARLSPERSSVKPVLRFTLLLLALVSLVIGLVNPRIGTRTETIKREGIDIVFAVDVSKSMLCEDIAPNRLEKSKQIVSQIINQLAGDRIGIVAYAGAAFPMLPITTDYSVAKMFLQGMSTDMVSSQGTALDDAIMLATGYFDKDSQTSKLVILLSDGEDHGSGFDEALSDANKQGVRILSVGVGTEKGGPIPIKQGNRAMGFKRDMQDEVVITKRNVESLRHIGGVTKGGFVDGNNTKAVVDYVQKALENIERNEFETQQFTDYNSQFQWFIGFGILLIVAETLLSDRKSKWWRKLNLFNEKPQ